MSSGRGNTRNWVLEYEPSSARAMDPLMGWTSSGDMNSQVRLRFPTKEAAMAFAREKGLDVMVQEPHPRRTNVRAGGYGENFAPGRRGAWTH